MLPLLDETPAQHLKSGMTALEDSSVYDIDEFDQNRPDIWLPIIIL